MVDKPAAEIIGEITDIRVGVCGSVPASYVWLRISEQAMLGGEGRRGRTIVAAGLVENIGHVSIYRAHADVQIAGYFLVRAAAGDQAQHFHLTRRESGRVGHFPGAAGSFNPLSGEQRIGWLRLGEGGL